MEFGNWKISVLDNSSIISDNKLDSTYSGKEFHDTIAYFGGYLVCSRITIPEIANLIVAAPEMLKALEKISHPEGAFSRDHFQHAKNTIENIVNIAEKAIAKAKGESQ